MRVQDTENGNSQVAFMKETVSVVGVTRVTGTAILIGAVICSLIGCDGRPRRVPVSGRVLIDGVPLTLGSITLVPKGARPSMGKIDKEGHFVLTCYEGEDGVIPGTHRVAIAANEGVGDTALKWYAPKKYADFKTSGIEVTINEKNEELLIELTWDGGKPFTEGTVSSGEFKEGD